jgi:hypothetical protein
MQKGSSMTLKHQFAVAAACLMAASTASAQIPVGGSTVLDLSAKSPATVYAPGTQLQLGPGDYVVEAIAGTYTAWSAWASQPTQCRPDNTCRIGYITQAVINPSVDGTVVVNP